MSVLCRYQTEEENRKRGRETETGKKKIDGKKRGRDSLKMIKSIINDRVLEKDIYHKIKNYKKSIVEDLTIKISKKRTLSNALENTIIIKFQKPFRGS